MRVAIHKIFESLLTLQKPEAILKTSSFIKPTLNELQICLLNIQNHYYLSSFCVVKNSIVHFFQAP